MHPILIDLGPLQLPTYGVLMAGAFLAALWLLQRLARREGIDPEHMTSLWIWILLGGIVGAKLALYVVEWRRYVENPMDLLHTWRAAGVYYGGFIAAAGAAFVYVRRTGLPVGLTADLTAPAVALGQSVGRVGCFAAGCCYGKPSDLPWAVTFVDVRAGRITGVPLGTALHPTQAYLSLNALGLCVILLLLWRARRARGWPAGVVFWSYVVLYGATRFALEYLRADDRGDWAGLSTSQIIGIVGVLAGLTGLAVLRARRRADSG